MQDPKCIDSSSNHRRQGGSLGDQDHLESELWSRSHSNGKAVL